MASLRSRSGILRAKEGELLNHFIQRFFFEGLSTSLGDPIFLQPTRGNSKFKIQNSKFNAAVKARAEGACTLCQAEAVKHHPCGGVKFKIPFLRHCRRTSVRRGNLYLWEWCSDNSEKGILESRNIIFDGGWGWRTQCATPSKIQALKLEK